MSSGFLVSEVMRTVESRGREGLKELAPGPFLVEIPTQDPQGMNRLSKTPEGGATTSVKTMEFDEELLLASQRAVPEQLVKVGFEYRFSEIDAALQDLLSH